MKKTGYMDRAMRAADPRFARILGKLGYQRSDMTAAKVEEAEADERESGAETGDPLLGLRADGRGSGLSGSVRTGLTRGPRPEVGPLRCRP